MGEGQSILVCLGVEGVPDITVELTFMCRIWFDQLNLYTSLKKGTMNRVKLSDFIWIFIYVTLVCLYVIKRSSVLVLLTMYSIFAKLVIYLPSSTFPLLINNFFTEYLYVIRVTSKSFGSH